MLFLLQTMNVLLPVWYENLSGVINDNPCIRKNLDINIVDLESVVIGSRDQ